MSTPIHATLQELHGKSVIAVHFPNTAELNQRFRQLAGARWSNTLKSWYLPDTAAYRKRFGLEEKSSVAKGVPQQASANNQAACQQMEDTLQLKGYSASTRRTYCNELAQLLKLLGNRRIETLTVADLRRYMLHCITKEKLSENTIHSRLNALKFYYEQVLHREKMFIDIPRPKKQQQLPQFFNQQEIAAIINHTANLKQKVMLMLAYSCGLRVSEVVVLKPAHIDSQRICILIQQAKGKKDRIVPLSPVLLVMLREYWKQYRPEKDSYLFAGQLANMPYSKRSLQLVLDTAKKKAGILKQGSIHALRHSFATHLLDKGTDVTMIMKLMGHNDLKTTLRYLHVTNRDMLRIVSPLDDLNLK